MTFIDAHTRRSQTDLLAEYTLLNRQDVEQVLYLRKCFQEAKYKEWDLLLSTLLMDVNAIQLLFRDELFYNNVFNRWKSDLLTLTSKGYDVLVSKMDSLFEK